MRVEFDPNKCDVLLYQLAGYSFIRKWLKLTDTVLDIGCGEGYTTNFLAQSCHAINGIDSDGELQKRNRKKWTLSIPMISFETTSWQDYDPPKMYNVVICRDLIEHQTKEETIEFFEKTVNVFLRDSNSILFLGTVKEGIVPNRPKCQGHVYEWNNVELQHILERYFERVVFFSQTDEVVSLVEIPRLAWRWIIVCMSPRQEDKDNGGKAKDTVARQKR